MMADGDPHQAPTHTLAGKLLIAPSTIGAARGLTSCALSALQQVLPSGSQRLGRHRRLPLVVAVVLGSALLWWWLDPLSARQQFVLVIDAGSSGTRMLAYRWDPPRAASGVPLLTPIPPSAAAAHVPRRALGKHRAYSRVETEPGLDQFVSDREGLEATALQPLLAWAQAALPRAAWHRTPLFLFGTAGLRRLPDANQEELLAGAREVLDGSVFRFRPAWARVIAGADEGVFGWVALNYVQVGAALGDSGVLELWVALNCVLGGTK